MSRPDFTYSGNGSKFSFNLPAGWFAAISSLSRKDYPQAMLVSFNYLDERYNEIFDTSSGKTMGPMKGSLMGKNALSIIPQEDDMEIEVEFYANPRARGASGAVLVTERQKSNRLHVVKTQKRPGNVSGTDFVTLCAYVQDESTAQSDGAYSDAVGFVHLALPATEQ